PPEGLRFHIRQAMEIAGAQRIGHGVDVMYEYRPYELLKSMAERHILVEINLTHEYAIAAESFDLTYPDLKEIARNSIEYSFLPGQSLWRDHDYRHPQT